MKSPIINEPVSKLNKNIYYNDNEFISNSYECQKWMKAIHTQKKNKVGNNQVGDDNNGSKWAHSSHFYLVYFTLIQINNNF